MEMNIYIQRRTDGERRRRKEGRDLPPSLPSCGVGGAAAMIVLPRGGLFIDKKGLKVVFGGGGGGGSRDGIFLTDSRLDPCFRPRRAHREEGRKREGGRLPVLFLIYMNPKL